MTIGDKPNPTTLVLYYINNINKQIHWPPATAAAKDEQDNRRVKTAAKIYIIFS